jgi:FkbM family methyltransferase
MGVPTVDWNAVWLDVKLEKNTPFQDRGFWDKRAPEFARHARGSDYVLQFIRIMDPEPDWSVLDIGCAAGTIAVPLAPSVKSITAVDPSTKMLSLLDDRCRENGADNIRIVQGAWEDDWDALGIGVHDVAIASRSLLVDDLCAAVRKLESRARKRVYLSTLVDDGPYDRSIVEAVGRRFCLGADYIVVYNLLRQMGIYANVAFTVNREEKEFGSVEEAVEGLRWMLFEMTPEEEEKLKAHLEKDFVRENGRWKLTHRKVTRWAVLWWDKC